MSREILIVTPENIEIEYELAGIGSRLLANLFDTLIQIAIYAVGAAAIGLFYLLLGVGFLATNGIARALAEFIAYAVGSIAIIAAFLVLWGYFIWFEARWNGQTPGKRSQGLRVIRDGGYPVNIYAVIVRNLLRVIDGMPLLSIALVAAGLAAGHSFWAALGGLSILLPLCFVLFSSRYQRLGDVVAGTMVVKQRAPRVPTLEALAPPPRVLPEHLAPYALADI